MINECDHPDIRIIYSGKNLETQRCPDCGESFTYQSRLMYSEVLDWHLEYGEDAELPQWLIDDCGGDPYLKNRNLWPADDWFGEI